MKNNHTGDSTNIQKKYDDIVKRGYFKDNIQISPYRHERFPLEIRTLLEEIANILREVYPLTLDQWEDGFRRDTNPEQEIAIWLHTARVYKHITTHILQNHQVSHREMIFRLLVLCMNNSKREIVLQDAASMGVPAQLSEIVVSQFYGKPINAKGKKQNFQCKEGDSYMELVKILCAILLPPLGVFLQVGFGKHFWINIILTLLGYLPGIVHAVWVVAKNK